MATIQTINDYTHGSNGILIGANGVPVHYTASNSGTVLTDADYFGSDNGLEGIASLYNVAQSVITFGEEVTGVTLQVTGRNSSETSTVIVNGSNVNLNDLIANGDVTYVETRGDMATLDASGNLTGEANAPGGAYNFDDVVELTFNIPVLSIGMRHNTGVGADHFDVGVSDTSVVACFTAGTLIDTQNGPTPVESLKAGDRVRTKDHGFQPVKWVGGSRVHDEAVRIKVGTFGNARDLVVSPRHRMLLKGWQMGLLFNHDEAFATAYDLKNGTTITVEPEGWVTYYHVLLDRHEVIYAEGAETESFFPDEASLNSMARSTREELARTVDLSTFGRTVRPTLTANQAMYLSHNMDLLEDEPNQIAAQ